jgi:hypothetical protein
VTTTSIAEQTPTTQPQSPAKSERTQLWINAAVGFLIGLVAFTGMGFAHVLPPHRVLWLLAPSEQNTFYDPSDAYVAFTYLRNTPWMFPLGKNPRYGEEFSTAIFDVDSVAILAIFFKIFSPFMGRDFQYIGILMLGSFTLQGIFAMLISSRFTKNWLNKIIIAGFFVTSPIVLERSQDQYGLTAHWIVLWGLYLFIKGRPHGLRWVWFILAYIAIGFHMYFVPMVMGLWAADMLREAFRRPRTIPLLVVEGAGMVGTVLFGMWLIGYFLLPIKDASTPNFGMYAANLIGPFDSWGLAAFLNAQPLSPFHAGEGYCYFGFGMILLSAAALVEFLRQPISRREFLWALPLLVPLTGLALYSVSNKIALSSHVLIVPNFWGKIGTMLRSSGRMTWPPYYAAWLGIFWLIINRLKPWRATSILAIALVIQYVDFAPAYKMLRTRYEADVQWDTRLHSPFWALAAKQYHLILVSPSGAVTWIQPLGYWGSHHGIGTNAVGVGRYPGPDYFVPISLGRITAICQNQPDPDAIFVVP